MRGGPRVGLDNAPTSAYVVAAVLVLTLIYSALQVGFVRPYLPADPRPNLARAPLSAGGSLEAVAEWRDHYHADRTQAARWSGDPGGWARAHLGMIVQVVVFFGAAVLLFLLRSNDITASLVVLALAFSAVAGGGPLLGAEDAIPILGPLLTLFAWLGTPLAFPVIALAIAYFPSRSPLLGRYPVLRFVPLLAAAPMLVPALGTGLYLAGVDAAGGLARWDAAHPNVFYASFAAALGINVLAVVEGVYRYRYNHDANERRRIRMAVYTAVPGVFAYAIKDGVPIVAQLFERPVPVYPAAWAVLLQALVLLPAFGLVYAVGVARVLGPRVVLRRSLQYALANRSLAVLPFLPLAALVITLVKDSDKTIAEVAKGQSAIYVVLLAIAWSISTYRDRARQWLDQRFFREEYDARKILTALANRVRFETDPGDLATMVVTQIDEALHPEVIAILVSGVERGELTPVAVLHGSAESLKEGGGLVSMLRWSEEPLEIFLNDPRSPVRRLPPEEQEWLECSGASLLVPVTGAEGSLVALIALGEKRSEEAYTREDKQLLASIAAQMGLGFDVARLRRGTGDTVITRVDSDATRVLTAAMQPMTECPKCGRCDEPGTALCAVDGTAMRPVASIPRTVDNKYRMEQLLGRGGMGAVYRARDVRLDRLVALKVVRADLLGNADAQRRFRREAQIVAKLQHPAIVSLFDYGTFADGGAFLVMELVRGEDLRHVLQREGRLDPPRSLRILTAVCGAIEAAHREGVLHRDLKPENILLPTREVDAKVLDFGVAKVVNEDRRDADATMVGGSMVTAAGMIVGTPAYMAPEQLHGHAPDARTDVFSLGVIAFEMMTGELPFGRGTLADLVLAHARGVLPEVKHPLPPDLDGAIRSALHHDPDKRPPSAQAFAQLLASAQ
jgi:eukaryotic-like serine/threonine-protein kinase